MVSKGLLVLQPADDCCTACREMPGELEKIRVWFRDYKVRSRLTDITTLYAWFDCLIAPHASITATANVDRRSAMLQTPDGKPQTSYGYNDECLNKEFTLGVISETHGFWSKLRSGERGNTEELSLQ